jgi:hypothetical protein
VLFACLNLSWPDELGLRPLILCSWFFLQQSLVVSCCKAAHPNPDINKAPETHSEERSISCLQPIRHQVEQQ